MDSTTEQKTLHGHCHRGGRKRWIKIPFFIATIVFLKSALIFTLWNYLVPDLFHGPEITYWQAMSIMVLAKLLVGFGGFGGFRGFGHRHHKPWKKQWLENLTPEEREKFNEKLRRNLCNR